MILTKLREISIFPHLLLIVRFIEKFYCSISIYYTATAFESINFYLGVFLIFYFILKKLIYLKNSMKENLIEIKVMNTL